jgi:hypothetical protein
MWQKLKTQGTTYTVGLFLVSTVSGVFLFFHLGTSIFRGMHEWLSMLLIVPVALHVWKNWSSLMTYFKRKVIYIPLLLSLAGAIVFAYPALTGSGGGGGNPLRATVRAMQNGTIQQVAPLYRLTPDALAGRLRAKGYTVASLDRTLAQVAEDSGREAGAGLMAAVAFAD